MTHTINIFHGDSAAEVFSQAMHPGPGECLAAQDLLSCGPLPPFQSIDQWTHVRRKYWEVVAPELSSQIFNRDLFGNTQAICEAESVVLWLGTGAADQLVLPWLIRFLEIIGSRAKVSTVQFTQVGDPAMEVLGLGLLNDEHIKKHPRVIELSENNISHLKRGWQAVTAPEPGGLLSVLADKSDALLLLRNSLQCLINRYPNHQSGLTRWDRELLQRTKENGPLAARIVGHTMVHNFDSDLVGDVYLFSRLRSLGATELACPLVGLTGNVEDIQRCKVALTAFGEDALNGRTNAIEKNGIDDWVLGVHLDSKAGTWWYEKNGELIRA